LTERTRGARWYTSVNEAEKTNILFRKNIENFVVIKAFFSRKALENRLFSLKKISGYTFWGKK